MDLAIPSLYITQTCMYPCVTLIITCSQFPLLTLFLPVLIFPGVKPKVMKQSIESMPGLIQLKVEYTFVKSKLNVLASYTSEVHVIHSTSVNNL